MQKHSSPSSQVRSELQSVSVATLGHNATAIQLFAVECPQVCTRTLLHCTALQTTSLFSQPPTYWRDGKALHSACRRRRGLPDQAALHAAVIHSILIGQQPRLFGLHPVITPSSSKVDSAAETVRHTSEFAGGACQGSESGTCAFLHTTILEQPSEDKQHGMTMALQLFGPEQQQQQQQQQHESLRLAAGYEDGSVLVWDTHERAVLASLHLFSEPVMALAVGPSLAGAAAAKQLPVRQTVVPGLHACMLPVRTGCVALMCVSVLYPS